MNGERNETHDPGARSFVESANASNCDFPIQNLPFGTFTNGQNSCASLCVAIGDHLLDLEAVVTRSLLHEVDESTREACQESNLNPLMGLGPARWTALRRALFRLLSENSPNRTEAALCLLRQQDVKMVLPVKVGDYTDFYASVHHAGNVGALFRPENPLLPNYKWVPVGYHGRASTIVLSGTDVCRPWGQQKLPTSENPVFAPSRRLDYEVEVGAFIGVGNEMGAAIPISQACDHIFGLCLVNDWSARDIQSWEYQPLGPFLAKSFATSISPWIITAEALVPFRIPAALRPRATRSHYLIFGRAGPAAGRLRLTVGGLSANGRDARGGLPSASHQPGKSPRHVLDLRADAHPPHLNGCDLRPGDLLASGTSPVPPGGARMPAGNYARRG